MADSGDSLHWFLKDTHVIFSFIDLGAPGGVVLGALLTVAICALERLLAFATERHWGPARIRGSRGANALWRAGVYWMLALLRLAYMLIAMTMHIGLILIIVTTLAVGQFFIELRTPSRDRTDYAPLDEDTPLYARPSCEDVAFPPARARSKPEELLIHSAQSSVARADAALATRTQMRYPSETAAWEAGKGPDVARALLGTTTTRASVGPRRAPFQIGGGESESDEDS
ncbi:copper transporter [Mycena latifolia]|nr:copper transporter [Mycena latifolia]